MPADAGTGAHRLLGVFAHPDDEVFCAGGAFAKYAAAGAEVMVVSATRGEAGQIRDATTATRRTLGTVREQELRAACEILGVGRTACLDYHDGTLADVDPEQLVGDVVKLLRDFRPDVVVTFGDDGAYGHPDHIAISQATTEAFFRVRDDEPDGPARLYHSHFPRSRLLMLDRLSQWLVDMNERFGFRGGADFVSAFSLFAQESTTMRYADDHVDVAWWPPGVYIVEQGEPATSLYLILSGEVEVTQEEPDGSVRTIRRMAPGQFFGEVGLVQHSTRTANVIAVEPVTCLVFSSEAPTAFGGRGADARLAGGMLDGAGDAGMTAPTTEVDVSAFIAQKVAAIAAHRSQFPIRPDMFPESMLREMFEHEYFLRVHPPVPLERELLG